MVFIWVSHGTVEPYTPRVMDAKVRPLDPTQSLKTTSNDNNQETLSHWNLSAHPPQDRLEGSFSSSTKQPPNPYEKSKQELQQSHEIEFAFQIMSSPVVTVTVETTIQDCIRIFQKKRYRHLPVISEDQKVVGIVSDRDIWTHSTQGQGVSLAVSPKTQLVKTIMKSPVLMAMPKTSIRQIAKLMFDERVGCIPILFDETELRGIITRSDILRAIVKNPPLTLWA